MSKSIVYTRQRPILHPEAKSNTGILGVSLCRCGKGEVAQGLVQLAGKRYQKRITLSRASTGYPIREKEDAFRELEEWIQKKRKEHPLPLLQTVRRMATTSRCKKSPKP